MSRSRQPPSRHGSASPPSQNDDLSTVRRVRGGLVLAVRHRLTQPIARRLRLGRCRQLHAVRRRLAPTRYTDCDPFALIEIDPERIARCVVETAPKRPQWGRVVGGDWDRHGEPFADRAVPRGLKQRFIGGQPWEETALYDAFVDQLQRFGNAWGHRSMAGFAARCREVEALYESLRRDGYRRQERLADVGHPRLAHRADEIGVDIGRDGTLYWRAYGQHRLALAQLLGFESVPVVVHRRHRRWQERRDRLRAGEMSLDEIETTDRSAGESIHPDLRAFGAAGNAR